MPQAVDCGRAAGRTAARAVAEGEPELLGEYETEWLSFFGEELSRAAAKRHILERDWDNLDNVIRECWVAFRGYHGSSR